MQKNLSPEERLEILRAADLERKWYSLDDKRMCCVCDRILSGRQIEVLPDGSGHYRLQYPTEQCPASIRHWFLCDLSTAPHGSTKYRAA